MPAKTFTFGKSSVNYYFNDKFATLKKIVVPNNTVLITDENVYEAHQSKFKGWDTIVLKPGEAYKNQQTVDEVIVQLIQRGVDRSATLVGVGGGVITDLTGYIASIYMRGIRFGFVPTSVLGLVDASIGGKNGVDLGVYKNMVGIIRQPAFLLHDLSLLISLPEKEWVNGFAEIIKHAAIKDAELFKELSVHDLAYYRKNKTALAKLIERNALIKTKVVQNDEFEKGDRKLLNFGHTLGHAIENIYDLSHGQAISIGMAYAAELSEKLVGYKEKEKLVALLDQYGLTTYTKLDVDQAFEILIKDKKKTAGDIHYILLKKNGKGITYQISLKKLKPLLKSVIHQL
ncbi:MAG: 3-dehydroquinate synthase [Bacteroidetes bacterium]|nr:3-dehydroquinate synthase [Bacteroidota bacterium]